MKVSEKKNTLQAIIGVTLPSIGLFGLCGNAISAFIYSRKCMRRLLVSFENIGYLDDFSQKSLIKSFFLWELFKESTIVAERFGASFKIKINQQKSFFGDWHLWQTSVLRKV